MASSSSSSQPPIDPSDHPSKRLKIDEDPIASSAYGPLTEYDHNLALANKNRKICLDRISIHKRNKEPGCVKLEYMLVEESWIEVLNLDFKKGYVFNLFKVVEKYIESVDRFVCPPQHLIFNALNTTPFHSVKVVILGQEPYAGDGAMGLSFSVPKEHNVPKVLGNIFKELQNDIGCSVPSHGNLEKWALQGVLLLNSVLTVQRSEAKSHATIGWEQFTNTVIQTISDRKEGVVFVLWGKPAQEKASLIATTRHHLILKAAHPVGIAAKKGFFGCKHFSQINQHLEERGIGPIDWQL